MCGWISWSVVDDGILRLDMPKNNCCDMGGAIEIAKTICPSVWRIDTYSGGKPDVMYMKKNSGWCALDTKMSKRLYNVYPAAYIV